MTDANNTFDFELVSPERKLMSEKAWQVTIPGESGNLGVRAGHASLVSSIRMGVIEIKSAEDSDRQRVFVAGGFADITASNCTILAEEAVPVSELNQAEIEKEVSSLEDQALKTDDAVEKNILQRKLSLAKAKHVAVSGAVAA